MFPGSGQQSEAIAKIRQLWQAMEKAFGARLTLHDHVGVFTLPDGQELLPGKNLHNCPCCRFWYGDRERCNNHCSFGAKRRAAGEKGVFVTTCFCGVTELVMPLRTGEIHTATIFAGMFRKRDFDVSGFPARYRRAYEELPEWDETRLPQLEALLTSAGYALLRLAEELRNRYPAEQGRPGQIRRFFRNHFADNVGLADLAAELGLSESRTDHILLATFGQGFSELLRTARLRQVEKILRETDVPLKKVASVTGFGNEYYLSSVFRKARGVSPGRWRKEQAHRVGPVPPEKSR